jgi:hypothetical protein
MNSPCSLTTEYDSSLVPRASFWVSLLIFRPLSILFLRFFTKVIMMLVNFNEIKRVIEPHEYGEEYTTGASVKKPVYVLMTRMV